MTMCKHFPVMSLESDPPRLMRSGLKILITEMSMKCCNFQLFQELGLGNPEL